MMMILPKASLTKIEKGSFDAIVENLEKSNFTGFIKIAFRKDELSVAEILFENGKILAAEIAKMKSKKSIVGDDAIAEMRNLEKVVVEIYTLSSGEIRKIFDMNRSFEVKEKKEQLISRPQKTNTGVMLEIKEVPKSEREVIIEKYNISLPNESEIDSLIKNTIGNSELYLDIEKQKILERYGIKKPREEEIEQIIANALGESEGEVIADKVDKDFETIKSEIIKILESKVGKPAKRAIEIVDSCKSMSELSRNAKELSKALKALVVFVPKKKVEEVISEIEERIGKKIG